MVIYFQMICWNHGANLIRYDLVCTKWTTCKLYMIARRLSRNLKWCQRPVVIGSRWPLTSKLYTAAAYLQPVQLVPDQEWKAKGNWESTQVGTVPLHALLLLLHQCFPPQMSLATNTEQWLCNIKSAQVLKSKLETKLKRSDWSTCVGSGLRSAGWWSNRPASSGEEWRSRGWSWSSRRMWPPSSDQVDWSIESFGTGNHQS